MKRQRNMVQMKEQNKTLEKRKIQNKTARIKKKKNLQGTNSGGNEAKNQINDLEHKETKNK